MILRDTIQDIQKLYARLIMQGRINYTRLKVQN